MPADYGCGLAGLPRERYDLGIVTYTGQFTGLASLPARIHETVNRIALGRCQLDLDAHQLLGADGREIPVTTMEFDLLRLFSQNPNRALSRSRILRLTGDRDWDPYDRSVDNRIARLRRKLESGGERGQLIRTVRNVGYMLVRR
jgi:two-component system phosphate regulon response regulator OmpR